MAEWETESVEEKETRSDENVANDHQFDLQTANEVLEAFKFFRAAFLDKTCNRMEEKTAVELTRIYFTASYMPVPVNSRQ